MADDPSKTQSSSLFPLESCPHVTNEAFNLFHSIDRELYTRLIQNLGRDPAESVQVMAFWMWLERESNDMNYLIKRMLSLPPSLLNELADETMICLKCVESDKFLLSGNEITLLPEMLSSPTVSLRFFHENRIAVSRGVTKIINTVCARAFSDILQRAWRGNAAAGGGGNDGAVGGVPVRFMGGGREIGESSGEAERRIESGGRGGVGGGSGVSPPAPLGPIMYNPYLDVPLVPLPLGGAFIQMPPPPSPPSHVLSPGPHHPPPLPVHLLATGGFPAYDLAAQRQMMSNELGEMLSRNLTIGNKEETINVINGDDQEQEVPPDDRTIFLTFSKGYPTSEDEVREFFTRRFGDFIEDLIMQEVGADEQVLYARMVAKSAAVIDGIVGGNKAKYSINGKHVWARKYVKKQQSRSPSSRDPSASPSTSQAASSSP